MLNMWLILRQADTALDQGRLDDAKTLLSEPEVARHRRGGELRQRLGVQFVRRAQERLAARDHAGAWKDIEAAAWAGVDPVRLEGYRREICEEAAAELERLLEQNQPQVVLERAGQWRQAGLQCPNFIEVEQACQAWMAAQSLMAQGDLPLALARLGAVPCSRFAALNQFRDQLAQVQDRFAALKLGLQEALENQQWREVIRLADELLMIAPQDRDVRRIRTLAWRELEPPTLPVGVVQAKRDLPPPKGEGGGAAAGKPASQADKAASRVSEPASSPGLPRRVILWIDGVGGFLICLAARVAIGQAAAADGQVDIPIFADISRLHGYISRDNEGYWFEALKPTTLRGQAVTRTVLRDGDVLTLGAHCQLQFHQPIAISTTARLSLPAGHRLPMGLDGVLLMAETLLLSDGIDAHIHVPGLPRPVALLRKRDELYVQSAMDFTVDGVPHRGRCSLMLDSTVSGDDWRFTLEPIGSKLLGRT
jgi:hypothetical protein